MRVVVVTGVGKVGEDEILQTQEFWDYGLSIVKSCVASGVPVEFHASTAVAQLCKQAPPKCQVVTFESVRDFVNNLNEHATEIQLLIVLAHGDSASGKGTAHLTHWGETTDRML